VTSAISRAELRAEVCRLLFGQPVPESELSEEDDLLAAGLDSMAILKLVAWIEKRTGRELPTTPRSESFRSLSALGAFVAGLAPR
jgi:aryl carrier-like protein